MEPSTDQPSLALTLEQQFSLQMMMIQVEKMSEQEKLQTIQVLIEQGMMKDNYFKMLGKRVISG